MKKITLICCLISTTFVGKGQNLVPNGDFEQYSNCPYWTAQLDSALYWFNPTVFPGGGGTPDYFNQCAANLVSVPDNFYGYQNALGGVAYSGIVIWYAPAADYREYIETPLTSSLVANACYHLEMHVNLANESRRTTDAIGVYLSNTAITGITNWLPLPFFPQINNSTGNIVDTLNWAIITADYTATGGESYLIIGNFKNDLNTITAIFNNSGNTDMAYIYIDDVSFTPCTGIEEQNQNTAINSYPNPVKDELYIKSSLAGKAEIIISDILGKEILHQQINLQSSIFNLQSFQTGIYFIEINNGKNIYRKKFIKE